MEIKIGDIVGRKSYGCDIVFKVYDILTKNNNVIVILKGLNLRILADAPEMDVVKLPHSKINENNMFYEQKLIKIRKKISKKFRKAILNTQGRKYLRQEDQMFKRPGRVLHLDGDREYMEACLKYYRDFKIEALGKVVPENEQPKVVRAMLEQYNPDILVLTGHDALIKNEGDADKKYYNSIDAYKNSRFFIEAVKEARKYEPYLDDLVIFAGACQSFFEGILAAGANFASSPSRIFIHTLDPAMVCQKIAFTPIDKIVPLEELINSTMSGLQGIGGIQTTGKYRDGMPKSLYGLL